MVNHGAWGMTIVAIVHGETKSELGGSTYRELSIVDVNGLSFLGKSKPETMVFATRLMGVSSKISHKPIQW